MLNVRKVYNNLTSVIIAVLSILTLRILYVSDSTLMNSDVTSKYFWLCETIKIALITTIVLLGLRRATFHFKQQDLWTLLFIGYIFINGYTSLFPMNIQTGSLILLGITYFVFRGLSTIEPKGNPILSIVLVAFGIVEIFTGFRQLYGFTESNHFIYRLTGSFSNPGPYSGFLVTILPLALYWAIKKYPAAKQLSSGKLKNIIRSPEQIGNYLLFGLFTLYVVGVITILPAGMSRSAWLAGVMGCGVVLGKHYRIWGKLKTFYRTHQKQTIIYSLIALLIISGATTGMYLMKKDSADGRILMWKISIQTIKEHPWAGVGSGKFAGIFGETQSRYFASGKATPREELVAGSPEYGFNEYLQITVEYGGIGLALFLLVIGTALWNAARAKQEGLNGVIGALVTMLVFACFSYPFRVLPLCLVFVILLAMTGCMSGIERQETRNEKWIARGFAICLLCLTFYITKDKEQKKEAYAKWREEQAYFNMGIYEETVQNYRALYWELRSEPKFLFELGQCLSKTIQYEGSNRILKEGARLSSDPMFYNIMGKNYQAMRQYKEAEACFTHASQMIPHRLYPLYLLANFYFSTDQEEKGIAMAKRVIAKKPKVMSTAVREMKIEMSTALQQYEK